MVGKIKHSIISQCKNHVKFKFQCPNKSHWHPEADSSHAQATWMSMEKARQAQDRV